MRISRRVARNPGRRHGFAVTASISMIRRGRGNQTASFARRQSGRRARMRDGRAISQEMRHGGQNAARSAPQDRSIISKSPTWPLLPGLNQNPVMKIPPYLIVLTVAGIAGPVIAADVLSNWKEHCAKCHGDNGKGDTKMGRKLSIRDLTDPAVQAKFTDEEAMKAMKDGVKDKDGKVTMKPVENLAAEDMPPLVKHVRGLVKK
jgi:hypothetical protein